MHVRHLRLPLLAATLLVATFATACSTSSEKAAPTEIVQPTEAAPTEAATEAPTPAAVPEAVIDATEYLYAGQTTVPAGLTKVTVANKGKELHQVALMQLKDGKTYEDFTAYAKTAKESDPMPDWMVPAGGPSVAAPGMQASTFVDLQAGTYVMMCNIPDAQGVPHFQKGMISPLTVTETTAAAAAAPEADLTIKQEDFAFGVQNEVTAGAHVFNVTNGGKQPHEAVLVKLNEGATAKDVAAAFAPGASGPPPALPVGGVTAIGPGAAQSFPADLAPGKYALLCFITDPASGKAHAELGMMAEFEAK
jgi:hypothetical protein